MACEGEIKSAPRAPKAMGFMRFLNLEFMPGFKHCRKNSLEAPHGCQKASWQMGCNFMTWCKGWEEKPAWHVTAPVPPSTHPALQQQPLSCWPTLPSKGGAPRETLLAGGYWSHQVLLQTIPYCMVCKQDEAEIYWSSPPQEPRVFIWIQWVPICLATGLCRCSITAFLVFAAADTFLLED